MNLLKIAFFSLLILFSVLSQGQMRRINIDPKEDDHITKISFYSASEGYVGFTYHIGFSIDSGHTFLNKDITYNNVDYNGFNVSSLGFIITGVKAFNKYKLLVYGSFSFVPAILFSSDGGNTFKVVYYSQFKDRFFDSKIMDMTFPGDGKVGYAIDKDRILKTYDQGITWTVIKTLSLKNLKQIQAIDVNNLFCFSKDSNFLIRSTDGGSTWSTINFPLGNLSDFYFLNSQKGWINVDPDVYNSKIYYTSNAGADWELKNNSKVASTPCGDFQFINDSTGFGLGEAFFVYKTTDSGRIWEKISRDNNYDYLLYTNTSLQILNSNQIWAGGEHGFLELTTNGGGKLMPAAYFDLDTTQYFSGGPIKLYNYSKKYYAYQWYVNNKFLGADLNASYNHDNSILHDTIMLVVFNGNYSDTSIKVQNFLPHVFIKSFSPTTAASSSTVKIIGKNFDRITGVYLGSVPTDYNVINDTLITATVGNGASGYIKVTSLFSQDSIYGFVYLPPPYIASFNPTTASNLDLILIKGKNFSNINDVSFGGTKCHSFQVIADTIILAKLGVGSSGSVSVKGRDGFAVLDGFKILPKINSFSPLSGSYQTKIKILGSGFRNAITVSVGGIPQPNFNIESDSVISVILSNKSSGDILVTTKEGFFSKPGFTYYDPPHITSFSPNKGPVGSIITLHGDNFNGNIKDNYVFFGPVRGEVVASSQKEIQVKVPVGATPDFISIYCNNLTFQTANGFIITDTLNNSMGDSSFRKELEITSGSDNYGHITIADLDGDGKIDIISTKNTHSLNIFRNNTNNDSISFDSPYEIKIPPINFSGLIIAKDINGDGKIDILVSVDGNLFIFLNRSTLGSLVFDAPIIPNIFCGDLFDVKDMDGDGRPDIIYFLDNKVFINKNISNDHLAFSERTSVFSWYNGSLGFSVCDLNSDGKAEVILSGVVVQNLSTPDGFNFKKAQTFDYDYHLFKVLDMNKDNKPDIIAINPFYSKVLLFQNLSDTNLLFSEHKILTADFNPFNFTLSDLDGDGNIDIISTFLYNKFGVIKNLSADSLSFSSLFSYFPETYSANSLICADLRGVGKPDIISFNNKGIVIFKNVVKPAPFINSLSPYVCKDNDVIKISGKNFTGTNKVLFANTPATSFLVTSDSTIEARVKAVNSGRVTVINSNGSGSIPGFIYGIAPVITQIVPSSAPVGNLISILGKNFDSTQNNSIVLFGSTKVPITRYSKNQIDVNVPIGSVYEPISLVQNNLSTKSKIPFITSFQSKIRSFSDIYPDNTKIEVNPYCGGAYYKDMDGDGKVDLITYNGDTSISIRKNISSNKKIAFGIEYKIKLSAVPYFFGFSDVNGDGRLDIIVNYSFDTRFNIFLNKTEAGNFNFLTREFVMGGSAPINVADLDMDGKPEIIMGSIILKNYSFGDSLVFEQTEVFNCNINYLYDLNNDGLVDLIQLKSDGIDIFKNISSPGKLAFSPPQHMQMQPEKLFFADFNNDSLIDILNISDSYSKSQVYVNNSTQAQFTFQSKPIINISNGGDYFLNDFDGDGKVDIGFYDHWESDDAIMRLYKNTSIGNDINFSDEMISKKIDTHPSAGSFDIDGDGKADIIILGTSLDYTQRELSIYRNSIDEKVHVTCENSNELFFSGIKSKKFKWQIDTGTGFQDITNQIKAEGIERDTLIIKSIGLSASGYNFRCIGDNDTSITHILSVKNIPKTFLRSDTTLCPNNQGVTMGQDEKMGYTYKWFPENGIDNPNLSLVTAAPDSTTTYHYSVTNFDGCQVTDSMTITIKKIPTAILTAKGPTNFCKGDSVSLSSSISNGNIWLKNGTNMGITGSSVVARESANYSIEIDQNGCTTTSNMVYVRASDKPTTPHIIPPARTSFCQGEHFELKTDFIPNLNGDHFWYKDGVEMNFSGPSINIDSSGKYKVLINYLGCNSDSSNEVVVQMFPTNYPYIKPSSINGLCDGDTMTLHAFGQGSYQWFFNGGLIKDNTSPYLTITKAGKYTAMYSNQQCQSQPYSIVIDRNPTPSTPKLEAVQYTLYSSESHENKWYWNGNLLATESKNFLKATKNGFYSVKAFVNGCFSQMSNVIEIVFGNEIKVSPNPFDDYVNIQFYDSGKKVKIEIIDNTGKQLIGMELSDVYYAHLNTQKLKPGIYTLVVTNLVTNHKGVKQIIKL